MQIKMIILKMVFLSLILSWQREEALMKKNEEILKYLENIYKTSNKVYEKLNDLNSIIDNIYSIFVGVGIVSSIALIVQIILTFCICIEIM